MRGFFRAKHFLLAAILFVCANMAIAQSDTESIQEIEKKLEEIDRSIASLSDNVNNNVNYLHKSQNKFMTFMSTGLILFGALIAAAFIYSNKKSKTNTNKILENCEVKINEINNEFKLLKKQDDSIISKEILRVVSEIKNSVAEKSEIKPELQPVKEDIKSQPTFEQQYTEAFKLYKAANYDEAGVLLLDMLYNNESNIGAESKAEIFMALAHCFEMTADTDSACNYYNKVLEIKPYNFSAWNNVAVLYSQSNNFDQAIKCFDRALEINPQFTDALINKGNLLRNTETYYTEALNCYNTVLNFNPNNAGALYGKGIILHTTGNLTYALNCYNKALEQSADNCEILAHKGLLLKAMGGEYFNTALQCFDHALTVKPDYDFVLKEKAMLLKNMGANHRAEALDSINLAIKHNPNDWELHNAKGILLGNLGPAYYTSSLACFTKAYELNGENIILKKNIETLENIIK